MKLAIVRASWATIRAAKDDRRERVPSQTEKDQGRAETSQARGY